jgi:hypothetical protein
MTEPVYVDLYINQGADWPGIGLPVFTKTGAPYDLGGCTVRGQIRRDPDDPEALFTWSTDPDEGEGAVAFDGSKVKFAVTGDQSALWGFTHARYDMFLDNPSAPEGERKLRIAKGLVFLNRQITR